VCPQPASRALGGRLTRQDVIVAGLPRSGTTLTCELLNLLPDVVALDEPIPGATLRDGAPRNGVANPDRVLAAIDSFLRTQRESAMRRGRVLSKHVDGRVSGSKVSDRRDATGLRQRLAQWGEIAVPTGLAEDFMLVIKHNTAFTALLPRLRECYPVFAVVRNPLALLASWDTVPFNVRNGRVPMGEILDPTLRSVLDATDDRHTRQLHLLKWFFARFAALPIDHVIRYEDLIVSGGGSLAVISPRGASLAEPLRTRNTQATASNPMIRDLAERLLAGDGPYWKFYSREEVSDLVGV
jgi:hypothetical protein